MRLRGFTFIEIVLTASIMLLLGALSMVFGSQFISARDTAAAVHTLRESLDRAQVYAASGRTGSDWGVTEIDGSVIVFSGGLYEGRNGDLDEVSELPEGITITGLDETIFNHSDGRIGASKTIDVVGRTKTIHLSVTSEGAVTEYE